MGLSREQESELNRIAFRSAEDALKAKRISLDDVIEAIESRDYVGFCLSCGSEASNVEPDARRYTCESCGDHAVYGAEELLMMLA
jgi:hypothetical protein